MNSKHTVSKNHLFGLAAAGGMILLGGCRNDAGTGALIGSAAGAGLGAIIGHQSGHGAEGALIGAGAGGLGGYIIGNESDKHKMDRGHHRNYEY
jgi:uncharacterized protein YcfJ